MRHGIDETPVSEIPALEPMHKYPNALAVYALAMFDPDLRLDPSLTSPDAKRRKAEELSGYVPPAPPAPGDEPSPQYEAMVSALSDALHLQSDTEYVVMRSNEITLYKMLDIMLSTEGGDSIKLVETMAKCGTAIDEFYKRLKQQYDALSLGDERLRKAISDGNIHRRKAISPERG